MTPIDGLGCNPGWEIRECRECGAKTKFPAKIVENLGLGDIGAICDECELEQRRQAEEEAMQANIEQLIERAGIPPAPEASLHPAFGHFLSCDSKPGLYVHGVPGVGKTTQACQAVREWAEMGRKALYITERQYFQASWDNDSEMISRMKKIPLLIVDDLGTDHQSDWSAGEFFALVDARYAYQNKRKTIWVSNHDPQELTEFKHFGDRALRRIAETCGEPLHMT